MKNYLTILVAAACALGSCTHTETKVSAAPPPLVSDSLMKMISIDTVRTRAIGSQLRLSGEIGYDENHVVKVFPNSSGQVLGVNVSFGDYVHRGQTLAVIKSADVAGNYSDLTNAQADVRIAKRQYENARSLYEGGISSQREYEEAKENYDKAVAAAGKINALIRINGGGHTSASGQYTITAPADGYIVEKKLAAGAFLRGDMGDNLFTISDLKNVWVWANVYESDIARVHQGYHADVTTLAYPGKIFSGKVDQVNDLIDPQNKSLRVRITLRNDSLLLKPQMFANVTVTNQEARSALSVPTSAIVTDNGKSFVVVYNNPNDVKVRPVTILKAEGGITYLADGVQDGERVVSQNQLLIYNSIAGK